MPWIVYETRCLVSGKIYVGVHKQDGDGFDGYLGSGMVLGRAIAKHGRENFERRTLFTFESSEEAFAREAEIVTEEFCRNKSNYNAKPGGLGGSSEWFRRRWQDPEYRAKVAGAMQDPECMAKMAEASKRRWQDPEYRAKVAGASKRRGQDPKYRAKIAETTKRLRQDPEYRAKIAEATKRQWQDREYKAKVSQAMKAAWAKRRAAKQSKSIAEGTPARTDPCPGSSTKL